MKKYFLNQIPLTHLFLFYFCVGVFGRLTDTESQVHGALLALFMFILTHTTLVPFPTTTRSGANVGHLETFALTCCFLTMWTGLVFFKSRNPRINEILSVILILINLIFFICGIRIFWKEFAKEQDISVINNMKSLQTHLTVARMSAITTQFSFHRTASGRNIIEQQAGAEGENQVRANPLHVAKKSREDMRNRSLSGRSSVFKHRIRGRSIEQNDNRLTNGTRFGEMEKTKIQMKKIEMISMKKKQKRAKKKKQLEKELELEVKVKVKVKVDSSKEKRKSYYDAKSGNFYVVNKETGESSWEDDALNVTGNENTVEVKVVKE